MESLLVDGMVAYEDMYDGMVLQSVAGYPLLIQLDPFDPDRDKHIFQEWCGAYFVSISKALGTLAW
jgi:hypothetical protein